MGEVESLRRQVQEAVKREVDALRRADALDAAGRVAQRLLANANGRVDVLESELTRVKGVAAALLDAWDGSPVDGGEGLEASFYDRLAELRELVTSELPSTPTDGATDESDVW